MDMAKYRALFVTEAREHLEGLSKDLLTLEKNAADRGALDNVFRRAHSIKGMAASMGYDAIGVLSHKLEDLADLSRRGAPFDAETVQIWLEGSDWLADAVNLVEAGREGELALPTLMQRVLDKATRMVLALPGGSRSSTFPRLEPVVGPPPSSPRTQSTTGTVTEPGMAAVAPPPAGPVTQPGLPAVQPPATTTAPNLQALATPTGGGTVTSPGLPITGVTAALPSAPAGPTGVNRDTTQMLPAVGTPGGAQPTMLLQAVAPREWDVTVTFSDAAATPHVRAFLVHKRVTEKMEVLDMVPPLGDLKRGTLPDRTLKLRVRGTLDAVSIQSLVKAQTDVVGCGVLPAGGAAAGTPAVPKVAAPEAAAPRTVRVRTELLDELIDSVGEILLARARLRTMAARLDDGDLRDLADEFTRLAQGLHDRVLSARMTPVSILTDRLPRVVRDLAKKRGKDVAFTIEGGNIELDRAMLDELHDVVLHLVRNAVDHAHEGPQQRTAAGRNPVMALTLTASRDRDHVLIELQDDGKGMDPQKLRESGVDKGLLTPEAARALTDQQALELICKPGFSTAEEVSDTSGRGVGMDVVRNTVEHLGGQLLIESVLGQGTTFTLRLPLTVAIIRVLLVGAGPSDAVYALPLHRVEGAVDFVPSKTLKSHGENMYPLGDILAPLHDLGALLGWDTPAFAPGGTVVVLEQAFRPLAVRVERILGQAEVVVKPLGPPLGQVAYLAGAALLADGRPAYILDVAKLTATAQESPPAQEVA